MNRKIRKNNKKNKNKKKRRNYFFSNMSAPLNTKPTSFGPGSYTLNVTKLVKGRLDTEVNLNLYYDVIYENPEFLRIKNDFKYAKLLGLSVIFLPRNLPIADNQTPAYLLVNYDGLPTVNIRLQDNVKIISSYLTKRKVFRFYIPNISASTGSLKNYRKMDEINDWGAILIQLISPDNTADWHFRIEAKIRLKGPTNEISANKVIATTDMFKCSEIPDGSPIKEDIKKEEKKELKIVKNEELSIKGNNDKEDEEINWDQMSSQPSEESVDDP